MCFHVITWQKKKKGSFLYSAASFKSAIFHRTSIMTFYSVFLIASQLSYFPVPSKMGKLCYSTRLFSFILTIELLTAGFTLECIQAGFVSATPLTSTDCFSVCTERTGQTISHSNFFQASCQQTTEDDTHQSFSGSKTPFPGNAQILKEKANATQAIQAGREAKGLLKVDLPSHAREEISFTDIHT